MTTLPPLSPNVMLASTDTGGDGLAAAYDADRDRAHALNATGLALLRECAAQASVEGVAATWATQLGADPEVVARDVADALCEFRRLELVGRRTEPRPTIPAVAPVTPLATSEAHTVQAAGDHRIRFRSLDAALVDRIADALGMAEPGAEPTADFALVRTEAGGVTLRADGEWAFPSEASLFHQLMGVVNDFVIRTERCATLHAGGVVTPTGEVVLLPAEAGAGKSTLTAALVQHGWDYLGDEAIGVRPDTLAAVPYTKPLTLDATSCAVLGLHDARARAEASVIQGIEVHLSELRAGVVASHVDTAPVNRVILPRFAPGASPEACRLEGADALVALLTSTLNLRYAGEVGLGTLCELAARVPVHRITYGTTDDSLDLVASLLG